ncbi:TIGR03089 family protein [Labedaea rhizosphaerae]|uniref:Uncharacterized protein (TIGR03089 family) n=1 Tax=Labedaea rhizosphaerae TaxID=598644 RepID=A0A4R6S397_LABRH|nr:TIGR03089 family protein [Labedaea rhizosphaerae]TDP93684.1 uncharacterized protein (TIGR03089 family) [Labedaea rhizosphaerae]
MTVTERLFLPLLTNPARPVITHYDDATGSRVELSGATLANWAAKTANWLTEEYDVEPGDPVSVVLPAHWQTAGVLLGAWWCGAHVIADPAGARVTLAGPATPITTSGVLARVSLHPMGLELGDVADGVDYIGEARLHGDQFLALQDVPDDTPALAGATVAETVAAARAAGIPAEARVMSTLDWTVPDGVIRGFLAVLAAGGSLVQVSNPARLDAHRAAERTNHDLS